MPQRVHRNHSLHHDLPLAPADARTLTDAEIQCRVRGEYLEMPGLRLTFAQARRLWDLDAKTCQAILDELQRIGFLAQTKDGAFVRNPSSQ